MVSCNYKLTQKFTKNFMCIYPTTLLLHGPWCHQFRSVVQTCIVSFQLLLALDTPKLCQTLAKTQQMSTFYE
jgi:hypothetical protein